jgi:hypothetical protein
MADAGPQLTDRLTGAAAPKSKRSQSDFNMGLAPKFGKTEIKNDLMGVVEEDEEEVDRSQGSRNQSMTASI